MRNTLTRMMTQAFAQFPTEGLRVTGEAVRESTPEVIELGFDIHGLGTTAAFALQDCAIRMMQIGQALTAMGIGQSDLQAGPMSIRSIPLQAPALSPFTVGRPLLTASSGFSAVAPFTPALPQVHASYGYDVTSSVKVFVRDTTRLAEVVDAVMESGANILASLRFLLRDERTIRRTLLEEAVREAREKAEILAAAAGRSLGAPTHIEEDFQVYQPNPVYGDGYGYPPHWPAAPASPANVIRYPFTIGQLTFHASVSVAYQLQ
jgi:uncharacterized protein YggE